MKTLASRSDVVTQAVHPRARSSARGRGLLIVAVAIVLLAVGLAAASASRTVPPPAAAPAAAPPILTARGIIEPVAQATVATMNGGGVRSLAVRVGQSVEEGQRLAEISTPTQSDVLVAPWAGTVLGLGVQRGDTVMPGAAVAVIGDISRYRVRTTDIDEYLIGQIRPDQPVSMTVEALNGRQLGGTIDTVSLVQQASASGVASYPVVIRLSDDDPDLRPGMTVRIVLAPRSQDSSFR